MTLEQEQKDFIDDKSKFYASKEANKIKNWILMMIGSVVISIIAGAFSLGGLYKTVETQGENINSFMESQAAYNKEYRQGISATNSYANEIQNNVEKIGIELEKNDPSFKSSWVTRGNKARGITN